MTINGAIVSGQPQTESGRYIFNTFTLTLILSLQGRGNLQIGVLSIYIAALLKTISDIASSPSAADGLAMTLLSLLFALKEAPYSS
jgi:hypothetical protein